jgi:hypothetical protein
VRPAGAAEGVRGVDEIELAVFSSERAQPTERLYKLKREVPEFARGVQPLAAAMAVLALLRTSHSRLRV